MIIMSKPLIVFGPPKIGIPKKGGNIGLRIAKERHHFW